MNVSFRGASCIVAILTAVACSRDGPIEPPTEASRDPEVTTPNGVFLSNSVTVPVSSSNSKVFVTSGGRSAYISAAPGTYPTGVTASLTNLTRKSDSKTVAIKHGGFDPVAIEADAGDEIGVSISSASGEIVPYTVKVPARKPPSVVRSNPSRGRTDVALNVQIAVVFSEPIDAATVSLSSFGIISNEVVGAAVAWADDRLTLFVTPSAQLKYSTSYQLRISNVRDLDGDTIESDSVIAFQTVHEIPVPVSITGEFAFVSDRDGNTEIYRAKGDGTGITRLTFNQGYDGEPAWSPDGRRIAFVSARQRDGNNRLIDSVDVYLMDADGSNVERLTTTGDARNPAWSPDGKRVAYTYDAYPYEASDIAIIDVTRGENSRVYLGLRALNARYPDWSPDGSQILFVNRQIDNGATDLFTVRPDGTGAEMVLSGHREKWFGHPRWSPDGTRIAVDYCSPEPTECLGGFGVLVITPTGVITWATAASMNEIEKTYGDFLIMSQPAWMDGKRLVTSSLSCFSFWDDCVWRIAYLAVEDGARNFIVFEGNSPVWRPSRPPAQ